MVEKDQELREEILSRPIDSDTAKSIIRKLKYAVVVEAFIIVVLLYLIMFDVV